MMYAVFRRTFFNLEAISFEMIFASTLLREIGLQFSMRVRSLCCFSMRVMIFFSLTARHFSVVEALSHTLHKGITN